MAEVAALEEGDIEAAEAFYRQAVESRAPSIEAALRLAALRFEQGRPDEARGILEEFGGGDGEDGEKYTKGTSKIFGA